MSRILSFGLLCLFVYFSVATAPKPSIRADSFETARMVSGEVALGMAPGDVEQRLGKPHKLSAFEGDERWDYYQYGPYGRVIATAFVVFREGRVITFDRHEFAPIQRRHQGSRAHGKQCLTGSDGLTACHRSENAECRMGSDGHAACGFDCKLSSHGYFACAQEPDQICRMGADGHVACGYDCWSGLGGRAVCEQNRYEGGR